MIRNENKKPWERQQGESALWFNRFTYYRDLGPERTFRQTWETWKENDARGKRSKGTKGPNTIWYEAAKRDQWQRRAELWDYHIDEIRRHEEQEAVKEMTRRHIQDNVAMQELGAKILEKENWEKEPTPSDGRMLIKDGQEGERRARGLPDHLLEIAFEVSQLTDDELLEQHRIVRTERKALGSGDSQQGSKTR